MGVSSGAPPRIGRPDAAAATKSSTSRLLPVLPAAVEGYRSVGGDYRLDEPLRFIEFGGDDVVHVHLVYPVVGWHNVRSRGRLMFGCGGQRVWVVLGGFTMSWVGTVRDAFVDSVDNGLVHVVFAIFGEEAVTFGGGVQRNTNLGVG